MCKNIILDGLVCTYAYIAVMSQYNENLFSFPESLQGNPTWTRTGHELGSA